MTTQCTECTASLPERITCQDYFHQMLYLEADDLDVAAEVHHLMVLCYYIQHPSLYSPTGLLEAQKLLTEFVEQGTPPAEVVKRNRARFDSNSRRWKMTTKAASYTRKIAWTMTAADVVGAGKSRYRESVRAWAQSVVTVLKQYG